ncbi:4-hydroxyphenylacetate catabolism regulator HpaA [Xanthomonas oryzae pv. oryzae]|uniref:4-hydroxyphenylacetate catabolism regulator HpaA n=1 Tax=Xanthomonas oryzae TaxID=347 RepID=UPI00094A1029|nr:4-hydroxyphenylacetate catabolism regulator HpaA [Xanthomonas oryzae]OLH19066.1 4-hydroxyphenylacetate catabolism regulator HpaA [Xanthomonas oryzae pv. oryzae]OLH66874.1 4-hydroxyphenylacetate catabolism regulator HpaA [Xanthomonas oryzae pv. oryzae]OLI01799.1 4-hydroxyphenylacetate catabolism regulator HpaA [Xanthomonas oryzae pv. oryzae]OLI15799.1 4-hydroxyphenylacetate catabolism regulator HpaA [Xanthomonas oryzae pv. oryzae]OLI48910.1 4-hydroxyphenylacetate catabolism regulator HpaA [X
MIRRISPGPLQPSVSTEHGGSHHHADHHADAASTSAGSPADIAARATRLRPAPPRRRRRGNRSLDGHEDEFDANEQEEIEAKRECALRGRVSVAIAPAQSREHGQSDQHGGDRNTHTDDTQAGPWHGGAPRQVTDSIRTCIDAILNRYVARRDADPVAKRDALAAALVELRAIGVSHPAVAPLTETVWRLMREHLSSYDKATAAENLQTLRTRLRELMPSELEPVPALRNFHLLLPLILLNAEKPRRQVDRRHAITRLNTLLIEQPEQAAQEVRP